VTYNYVGNGSLSEVHYKYTIQGLIKMWDSLWK